MILTDIGEIGVHAGDSTYVLRPSLYAMSQLGDPSEVVNIFAVVTGDVPEQLKDEQFRLAVSVIYACAEDDLSHVFGHYNYINDRFQYVPGIADQEHVLPLARCLLKHGLIGIDENDSEPEEGYTPVFEARKHVAAAMAHLGMTERDAWNVTMTSLLGAFKALSPEKEKEKKRHPSKESVAETMAWFEAVEAARAKKQGAH